MPLFSSCGDIANAGVRIVSGNIISEAELEPLAMEHLDPLLQRFTRLDTICFSEYPHRPALSPGSSDQIKGRGVHRVIRHGKGQQNEALPVLDVVHYQILNQTHKILLFSDFVNRDDPWKVVQTHIWKPGPRDVKSNDVGRKLNLHCVPWVGSPRQKFGVCAAWVQSRKLCQLQRRRDLLLRSQQSKGVIFAFLEMPRPERPPWGSAFVHAAGGEFPGSTLVLVLVSSKQ